MRLFIILYITFNFSVINFAEDAIEPATSQPEGFDRFLKDHKDQSFKLKIPIIKGQAPEMVEVESGNENEIKLKSAMYKLRSNCRLRTTADQTSKIIRTIKKNKNLWVEHYNLSWGKVYRKNGHAFIHRTCL